MRFAMLNDDDTQDEMSWLIPRVPEFILGFEDEDEEDDGSEEESEEEEDESEENEDEESEEEDDGKGGKKPKKTQQELDAEEAAQALERSQAALRKERKLRKDAERALKATQRTAPPKPKTPAAKSDEDKEAERQATEREQQKSEKLAAKFVHTATNTAIIQALADPKLGIKFNDMDDVLSLINRDDIDIDQEDDDPSEVKVDIDDVKSALKALAKKKPHLVVKATKAGDGEDGKTGSKFGGKKGDPKKGSEAALMSKYPALNRR